MKSFSLFFALICFTFAYGQKIYHFDYVIEYERAFYKEDSLKKTVLYLTNSKDNSYFIELTPSDSLNYNMVFTHQDNMRAHMVDVPIKDVNQAEFINLSCNDVYPYPNKYKNATERYDFIIHNDTLINQNLYTSYELRCIQDFKKCKRRQAGTNFFIVDKSTSFHLPILTHPTEYEEWNLKKRRCQMAFFMKENTLMSWRKTTCLIN